MDQSPPPDSKRALRAHWTNALPGHRYGRSDSRRKYFEEIAEVRYRLEPYIPEFAGFANAQDLRVLEIGVGTGQDFTRWAQGGAEAVGLDLTHSAAATTREALEVADLLSIARGVAVGDAENLPFRDGVFDVVYAWGVLHHSPDMLQALRQSWRVLKPGGELRFMVYHARSWTALLFWLRWGLLQGRPFTSPRQCVYHHLESTGTKAYYVPELTRALHGAGFQYVRTTTRLSPGDLLTITPSQRYRGFVYRATWALYPRWLIRMLGDRFGLYLMAKANKPSV